MYYIISNNSELYHHGIKGQKWGVRRFQNPDGTYTNAGKERRNNDERRPLTDTQKRTLKKVAAGVGIGAVAVGGLVLAAKRPDLVVKAGGALGKIGAQTVKSTSEALKRSGKAAVDAAITSAGAIAITKLGKALENSSSDEDTKKVVRDATNAASNSFSYNNRSGNQTRKGGPVSREDGAKISAVVGPPKQKDIDRSGPEYQALFKDSNGNTRSADDRAMIKSMASAGYGIDQIQKYLDSFAHSVDVGREYLATIL